MTYDDADEESEGQRALDRAYALLEQAEAERPQREAEMAARQEAIERGEIREWRLPEPEPPPRRTTTKQRRNSMDERERRNLANFIRCAVERQVAAALRRERAELADAIGKAIAGERKQFRAINDGLIGRIAALELEQRAAPDNPAAVFDLSDERRRRA